MRLNVEIVSALLLGLAALEILAIPVAWAYGEPMTPFVWSALPAAVSGAVLLLWTHGADRQMRPRDGLFVVCTAWVLVSLFGALPYITVHHLGIVDAIFESTSGRIGISKAHSTPWAMSGTGKRGDTGAPL